PPAFRRKIEGEDNASCHREALAWEFRTAESSTRRRNRQGRDGRAGLRRRIRLRVDGGSGTTGLGREGLQARHREQAEAALQEAGIRPVGIATTVSDARAATTMKQATATMKKWNTRRGGSKSGVEEGTGAASKIRFTAT